MEPIRFFKMSGSGNDFIIVDNREHIVKHNDLPGFIAQICRRKMSVGADGVILIEPSKNADFKWQFFNSDGSNAEMCGNGARCAARFAYVNGIAGQNLSFETDAGVVSGQVKDDRVKLKMPDPVDLKLDYNIELKIGPVTVCSVNTGVPHVVVMNESIDNIDVFNLGSEIRFHEAFKPAGTNVNFISQQGQGHLAIRTYERGVENETLACGTGSIAAALIASCKTNWPSPIHLLTHSGGTLTIHFKKDGNKYNDIYLEGDARIIYSAQLGADAWKS
ncbi:MAG: diaminopimelate epimerase [Desulfobacterales bacterium]|jgi:diaminopimelate epimerase